MDADEITSFEGLMLRLGMVSGALARGEFSARLEALVRTDPRVAGHVNYLRDQLSALLLAAAEK